MTVVSILCFSPLTRRHCPVCKEGVQASKEMEIFKCVTTLCAPFGLQSSLSGRARCALLSFSLACRLPKVLVVQLKRFSYSA
jgi:ubiquitin C-terminal hydrolase